MPTIKRSNQPVSSRCVLETEGVLDWDFVIKLRYPGNVKCWVSWSFGSWLQFIVLGAGAFLCYGIKDATSFRSIVPFEFSLSDSVISLCVGYVVSLYQLTSSPLFYQVSFLRYLFSFRPKGRNLSSAMNSNQYSEGVKYLKQEFEKRGIQAYFPIPTLYKLRLALAFHGVFQLFSSIVIFLTISLFFAFMEKRCSLPYSYETFFQFIKVKSRCISFSSQS